MPSTPRPSMDPALFTHALIVLTVVVAAAVLLGLGKIDATSATPLFGAALGIAPRASRPSRSSSDE
jgi:hypothetical protein